MKPISFCITSAYNEKDYTLLLLDSLKKHTDFSVHEVLVFVDTDNQNTYETLLEYKKDLRNLKVCKNHTNQQTGYQRNIPLIFNAATNDIVCYLQSDMVVGQDFDKHIIENIDENTVVACSRIEPPLHPASPEKIVKDFGISPEEFKYDEFNAFVKELQSENRPNEKNHFAPFAIYKKTWFEKLGGFDTQFRSSREDADIIIRMHLAGLKTIQNWNACVYHFTCVSSRGHDWYKNTQQANYKNELQGLADQQELKKFIRKWGFFGLHPRPMYEVAFEIDVDRFVNIGFLKYLEPYCSKLYISDKAVRRQLIDQVEFDNCYYNNLRWNYSAEYWEKVKHLFNLTDFEDRIRLGKSQSESVVISFKYSELVDQMNSQIQSIIENTNSIVHDNEIGSFIYGPLKIDIRNKEAKIEDRTKISNIDLLLNDQQFTFV